MLALMLPAVVTLSCGANETSCEGSSDCGDERACVSNHCQTVNCRTNLDCPADAICFENTAAHFRRVQCGP